MNKTKQTKIVLAWTEDTMEIAPGQKMWRADLGERPRMVDTKSARAAMWSSKGTTEDVAKATAYIQREYPNTGKVFSYPTSERDPLNRARREILGQ